MELPAVPMLGTLESISPSFYNTALVCRAKAAWFRFAPPDTFPGTSGAILGGCFHAVMELANRGQLSTDAASSVRAKAQFDVTAQELFAKAHPLIRAKFRSPANIPYYHQRRARAVEIALRTAGSAHPVSTDAPAEKVPQATPRHPSVLVEKMLATRDRLIAGRIDLLDEKVGKIIDYKSGHAPREGTSALAESELRQLRLYAQLARENGYDIATASIVRGDGTEVSASVSPEEAAHEADAARGLRAEINAAATASTSLAKLATPASSTCAGCPCMPACEPFWEAATPEWEELCGTNADGKVTDIHSSTVSGTELVTLTIDSMRGSAPRGILVVEQVPRQWLSLGSIPPAPGDNVRVVQASRYSPIPEQESRALRVDRLKSTTIWRVPSTQT